MQRKPAQATGIISSAGSASCKFFGNGTKVVSGDGKVKITMPDGTVTEQEGSGFLATKVFHNDNVTYDVQVKVYK